MKIATFAIGAVAALAASSSALAAENQFDLVCWGASSNLQGSVRTSDAYNHVFHINLVSAQYCLDECASIGQVSRFDPLQITLVDVPRHGGITNTQAASTTIDRRSGKLKISDIDVGALWALSVEAGCLPRPFTPFPVTKF